MRHSFVSQSACGGQILAVGSDHLAFLDHVHEFDALQGDPGRMGSATEIMLGLILVVRQRCNDG